MIRTCPLPIILLFLAQSTATALPGFGDVSDAEILTIVYKQVMSETAEQVILGTSGQENTEERSNALESLRRSFKGPWTLFSATPEITGVTTDLAAEFPSQDSYRFHKWDSTPAQMEIYSPTPEEGFNHCHLTFDYSFENRVLTGFLKTNNWVLDAAKHWDVYEVQWIICDDGSYTHLMVISLTNGTIMDFY